MFSFKPHNLKRSKFILALLCGSLTIATPILSSANSSIAQFKPQAGSHLPFEDNVDIIPERTAKKLINQVAKETNQSPNQIIITAVKSSEFDGCLGIYERPDQPCTKNLIYGWKVIVNSRAKNKPQNLIYHLDRNGTRIIQNKIASGAKSSIQASFDPLGLVQIMPTNSVFSSSSVDQRSGREIVTQLTFTQLTEDGKITIRRGKAKPIVIKTISPAQVNAFKTELENQRSRNFTGIHYLTNSPKTDFLTTNYQTQYIFTQVMDSQRKNLPPSLQRIIETWENLIQPTNPKLIKVQQLLQEKKWEAANQETQRLLALPETSNSLIRDLDRAWLTASNNRFGLSIQAKIWQQAKAKYPKNSDAAVNEFRDRVGWKLTQPRMENDFISSDWLNESELNYSIQAPIGHLPWAGVPDAQVQATLNEIVNGCGSCTTDAMQMRNEHFYRQVPAFFDRIRIAMISDSILKN